MNFTTFSEFEYVRPDLDAVLEAGKKVIEDLKNAADFETQLRVFKAYEEEECHWSTMETVASIRNTANTDDAFYEEEMKYFNSKIPSLALQSKEIGEVILESPWRAEWEEAYGKLYLQGMEINKKLQSPDILEDSVTDSNLRMAYSKAAAVASTEFRGETVNFYGLLKHMQSLDREERKEAMIAWGDLYAKVAPELDGIYDQMIELRKGIAKKLGFESYIDYIYLQRGRYDYTAADVDKFRKQVREVIVPVCQKLRDAQKDRLGIDKLNYYDESLIFPDGNPTPHGTKDEMVKIAKNMYRDMSAETGAFFDFMVEHDLFDLETRPGKRGGGYCTFMADMKAPFIFSNFNGTSADVDVLTHEAGHAFAAFTAAQEVPSMNQVFSTSEIAEIHSMTMETWAYPYMDGFFGDKADDYRYAHLMDALMCIPYMCAVDEFQHRMYEGEFKDAKARRAIWHELEEAYMPWRTYDGHEFLTEGGFWMQKQHIFLFPFYYVDYALAQICAFNYYGMSKEDREGTWADYMRLCKCGGKFGYFDTLKYANLLNPFEEGTVKKIVDSLLEELKLA